MTNHLISPEELLEKAKAEPSRKKDEHSSVRDFLPVICELREKHFTFPAIANFINESSGHNYSADYIARTYKNRE